MNPFKYKEATLTSGFYFDFKKKVIVYLDIDVENVDFGSKTIYSRLSENPNTSSLEMLMSMSDRSNISNLCDLSILDEEKELTSKLRQDFKWICKDPKVKECFINFLEKNELYNLLYLFEKFHNPEKPTGFTEKEQDFIDTFLSQF